MTQTCRSLVRLSAAALIAAAPLSATTALAGSAPAGPPGALQLAFDAQLQGIQRGLNRLGYDAGPSDGLMGARTRAAIEAYQRDHGLLVTGQASASLAEHIRDRARQERADQRDAAQDQTAAEEADRQTVLQLQSDLRRLGYDVPIVSGRVDAPTQEAIRAYQRDNDLLVDGRLTPELTAHVRGRTSAGKTVEDRATVRAVQQALNERGYDAGPADGVMGSSTRDAIRTFQSDAGLPLTGRISPELTSELGLAAGEVEATEETGTPGQAAAAAISDDFGDGDYTSAPSWEVVTGSWRVQQGKLTSEVPVEQQQSSPEQLGSEMIQGILGNALGLQQAQEGRQLAAIHTRADLGNAFVLTARVAAGGTPAVLHIGPYQGSNVGHGYRLELGSGSRQPLRLLTITDGGSTVIGTAEVDVRFDDGAEHEVEWRRDANGLHTIKADGKVVLQVRDRTYQEPFDGLSLVNAGGSWTVDAIEARSLQ